MWFFETDYFWSCPGDPRILFNSETTSILSGDFVFSAVQVVSLCRGALRRYRARLVLHKYLAAELGRKYLWCRDGRLGPLTASHHRFWCTVIAFLPGQLPWVQIPWWFYIQQNINLCALFFKVEIIVFCVEYLIETVIRISVHRDALELFSSIELSCLFFWPQPPSALPPPTTRWLLISAISTSFNSSAWPGSRLPCSLLCRWPAELRHSAVTFFHKILWAIFTQLPTQLCELRGTCTGHILLWMFSGIRPVTCPIFWSRTQKMPQESKVNWKVQNCEQMPAICMCEVWAAMRPLPAPPFYFLTACNFRLWALLWQSLWIVSFVSPLLGGQTLEVLVMSIIVLLYAMGLSLYMVLRTGGPVLSFLPAQLPAFCSHRHIELCHGQS